MEAKRMYDKAYEEHYKMNNPYEAYWMYDALIKQFPNSKEAQYAATQKNNIEKNIELQHSCSGEKLKEYKDKADAKIEEEKQTSIREKEGAENFLNIAKEFISTTGYNVEGYKIIKYLNIVHGEVVLGTGLLSEISISVSDFMGTASTTVEGKISRAKEIVQEQLVKKAILKGGNALIGVDFDISSFSNNVIMVSANGTAVLIEKEEA